MPAVTNVVAVPPGDSQTNTAAAESGTPTVPTNQPVGEPPAVLIPAVTEVAPAQPGKSQIGIVVSTTGVSIPAVDIAKDITATETCGNGPANSRCLPIVGDGNGLGSESKAAGGQSAVSAAHRRRRRPISHRLSRKPSPAGPAPAGALPPWQDLRRSSWFLAVSRVPIWDRPN